MGGEWLGGEWLWGGGMTCIPPGPCCIKRSANLVLAEMLQARQQRGCVCCIKVSQIASPYAGLADLRSPFLGTK